MTNDPRPPERDDGHSDPAFAPLEPGPEQLRAGHPTTAPAGTQPKARMYLWAGLIVIALLALILAAI